MLNKTVNSSILSSKLLVFTATYNEKDNITFFLEGVWRAVPSADILIVDDSSPDGTGVLLDQLAQREPRLKVVHRPGKLGLGTAHHLGILFAIRGGYSHLITMDADLSHDPSNIPALLNRLATFDFVIGSRYMDGGSCDYKGYRRNISIAANIAARKLLGIPLHEFTTSFRAFQVSKLAQVDFVKLHNNGYSFFMESVYRFSQAGLTLSECPINFRDRYAGTSKIPKFEIFRGIRKLLQLFISRLFQRRMGAAKPLLLDACSNCGGVSLSTRFPAKMSSPSSLQRADDFRCTSMAHDRKPTVGVCMQCGLAQIPFSERPQDLSGLYADVIDNTYLADLNVKRKTFSNTFKRIAPFIPSTGLMLEIGSYCGLFLEEATHRGWKVVGVEPSTWATNYAKSNSKIPLEIINSDFEHASVELNRDYDVLVSWDVLEHVPNPRKFIETSVGLIKPGGIFAFSTVDIDSWFARLMRGKWPWIMEMHLYYFGAGSLERMLLESGFDIIKVEGYRHYASLPYAYEKFHSAFSGPIKLIFKNLSFLIPNITVPICLGDIKLYICRKKVLTDRP